MKERPALMNADAVRAVLAGSKTQMRRIIKPTPEAWIDRLHGNNLRGRAPYNIEHEETGATVGYGFQSEDTYYKCPYGRPGERLYVRETWRVSGASFIDYSTPQLSKRWERERGSELQEAICYAADEYPGEHPGQYRPSIHMPRWASRLTLEVTGVRVERLQDVSAEDALAEGVCLTEFWTPKELEGMPFEEKWWDDYQFFQNYPQIAFKRLWESINGPGSWEANPWVWVIVFKRLEEVCTNCNRPLEDMRCERCGLVFRKVAS